MKTTIMDGTTKEYGVRWINAVFAAAASRDPFIQATARGANGVPAKNFAVFSGGKTDQNGLLARQAPCTPR
jgi:hypothetical protein